jgi:phage protein D
MPASLVHQAQAELASAESAVTLRRRASTARRGADAAATSACGNFPPGVSGFCRTSLRGKPDGHGKAPMRQRVGLEYSAHSRLP